MNLVGGFYISFYIVFYLFFVFGWISAYYFRKQFLMSLLSLELVMLGLFLLVVFLLSSLGKPMSIAFYLLVLGACEASLGLSLLVNMVRLGGSDMLSLFSFVKC